MLGFSQLIDDFQAKWGKFDLVLKQKIMKQIISKMSIEVISPHWFLLRIHWLTPLMYRPDIALIWRSNQARKDILFEQWELDLIRQIYPHCESRSELLRQLPIRTWKNISNQANNKLKIKKPISNVRVSDFPFTACWQDAAIFSNTDEAIKFIEEAISIAQSKNKVLCAFWLPANIEEIISDELLTPSPPVLHLYDSGSKGWLLISRNRLSSLIRELILPLIHTLQNKNIPNPCNKGSRCFLEPLQY